MKVFEILRDDVKSVTEEQIIERMKRFDWKYEFSDDMSRVTSGLREMELIENMVYQFWKQNPNKAVKLWWDYSDGAPSDRTIVPSFILRLQAQEKQKI
jgi:hypothetical protein